VDDGIDASVCAQSGASALKPRPSAAQSLREPEDAPRPDLMAAVIGTVRVSNMLVQSVDVDVEGCSHPHLHLYYLGRLSSLSGCSFWCVTHDPIHPKRKVTFNAVVAVAPRYSLQGFRAGVMTATWRAMLNEHDVGRPLLPLPLLPTTTTTTTTTTIASS
jgi:hypothetical protein